MHDKCQFILRHYKYAHAISLSIGLGWIGLIKWYRELEAGDTKSLKSKWRDPGSNLAPLATPLQISMCKRRKRHPPPKKKKKKSVATDKLTETYPSPIWTILHIRPIHSTLYFCLFRQIYFRVGMQVCLLLHVLIKNIMMMITIILSDIIKQFTKLTGIFTGINRTLLPWKKKKNAKITFYR